MEGVDGDVVVYMKSRPREAASERRKRGQEGPRGDERTRDGKEDRRNGVRAGEEEEAAGR